MNARCGVYGGKLYTQISIEQRNQICDLYIFFYSLRNEQNAMAARSGAERNESNAMAKRSGAGNNAANATAARSGARNNEANDMAATGGAGNNKAKEENAQKPNGESLPQSRKRAERPSREITSSK